MKKKIAVVVFGDTDFCTDGSPAEMGIDRLRILGQGALGTFVDGKIVVVYSATSQASVELAQVSTFWLGSEPQVNKSIVASNLLNAEKAQEAIENVPSILGNVDRFLKHEEGVLILFCTSVVRATLINGAALAEFVGDRAEVRTF